MSVAEAGVALQSITWDDCNRVVPISRPQTQDMRWGPLVEEAAKAARKQVWLSRDKSEKNILTACYAALRKRDPEGGEDDFKGLMPWVYPLTQALANDITVMDLPSLDGIGYLMSRLDSWWPDHWEQQDQSDEYLARTDCFIELNFISHPRAGDAQIGRLLWLEKLREAFPGRPTTFDELSKLRHRRHVFEVAEKYAAGMDEASKEQFFSNLEEFARRELDVPVDGDSVREAQFVRDVHLVGLSQVERCRVAAALLQTAAEVNSAKCLKANAAMHPLCGYALVFGDPATGNQKTLVGAAPGCWRLQVEGEQYILTCELWSRPVVMTHHEFGRSRGSANAILRDAGVSVDSPPGHWKKVWETYGLRNQLLAAADRIDPDVRLEEFRRWFQQLAAGAPAADRPPIDGSVVRLADGATVADPRWLIERALADGVIHAYEKDRFANAMRQATRETNRRDSSKRQRKLAVIEAAGHTCGTPCINRACVDSAENNRNP